MIGTKERRGGVWVANSPIIIVITGHVTPTEGERE
jgi:hypothetical protein